MWNGSIIIRAHGAGSATTRAQHPHAAGGRGRADGAETVRIALATPRVATSVGDALTQVERWTAEAADRGARIVCFPEAYVPGLRGLDFEVPPFTPRDEARVLESTAGVARRCSIAIILGVEHHAEGGPQIAAAVFDASGRALGLQAKVQLDPTEEAGYVPGGSRQLFDVDGLRFGIAICHEGFRYPETVRWAARRGAQVVFHPHCTGSDRTGTAPVRWLDPDGAYYERAMTCRALENTIYLAGVNYAFRHQESATCVISPAGECEARLPYGEAGLLVHDLDLPAATGLLAGRLRPDRLGEPD